MQFEPQEFLFNGTLRNLNSTHVIHSQRNEHCGLITFYKNSGELISFQVITYENAAEV